MQSPGRVVAWKVKSCSKEPMEPMLEPSQYQPGRDTVAPGLLFRLNNDGPQMARIVAAQQLLFPSSPRSVCNEVGLNWLAVLKLHEDGWLSFAPDSIEKLDEVQEAELRFVGALVVAGCDRNMLSLLLADLPKPFAYDLRRLYFDWTSRHWRLLPDPVVHHEAAFTDWVEILAQTGDVATLTGIEELARDALGHVQARSSPPTTQPDHRSVTSDDEETQG